jgi:hypothetical protein
MNILLIFEAIGIVTKDLTKNLKAIPGKHSTFTTKDSDAWNITHNVESTAHET